MDQSQTDWGYSNSAGSHPKSPRAHSAVKSEPDGQPAKAGTRNSAKSSPKRTNPSDSSTKAVADWLQLYQCAARQPLSEEEKATAREILKNKLAGAQK